MERWNEDELQAVIAELSELEAASTGILVELKRVQPCVPDDRIDRRLFIEKLTAAAVITSPADVLSKRADPRALTLAMQIRSAPRDTTTLRTLENPGGALLSIEEKNELVQRGIDPLKAPGDLFYQMTGAHFEEHGAMPVYAYDVRGDLSRVLEGAGMELAQEMGERAAGAVRLTRVLEGTKVTDLTTINFGARNDAVLAAHGERLGLTRTPKNTIQGIVTRVRERCVEGVVDDVSALPSLAVVTEEAQGVVTLPLQELLSRGRQATESVDWWENFNDRTGLLRPRAPSTFWQVRTLLEQWLADQRATEA